MCFSFVLYLALNSLPGDFHLSLAASINLFVNIVCEGYHTLYEWYRSVESEHFPDPTGLRERIERWTFGLYPACIKYLMSAFDVPEARNLKLSSIVMLRD